MTLRPHLSRLALVLLLIAAAIGVALQRDQFTTDSLTDWIGRLGTWAPFGYVVLYALATVAFVPGAIFGLAGGALFGPLLGSVLNLAGATLGATLAFLVARYIAADWIGRKTAGRLKRFVEGVEAEGWRFVAFIRLVPIFPFNLSNYALGLTRIALHHYALASLVCMAPGTVAYTWLGYAGRTALGGEADAIRYGLLALGLLAAIALLPRLLRRMRDPLVWIEPIELKRRLDNRETITVVDVRGPEEFMGVLGHIPDARNLPMPDLADRLSELKVLEGEPLVLVCLTDKRSAKAAALMRAAGFRNISVLHGGMKQWNESKLPVAHQRSDNAPNLS
jgi:uncharacterized membrane protein YdjX (TVP38/TMEM64 family)/rhodanese-related sulfurtransferase